MVKRFPNAGFKVGWMKLGLLFFLTPIFLSSSAFAQQTRIYIANDDHTDFMWTADAATYESTFVEMLDWHLKLADETATNPAPYRNRFNADGSYWLWNYEQKKTPAEFNRLMERVEDGTISAPLNTLVSCYGGQPVEAVLRGMYFSGRLERKYDLRFSLAVAMENQTLPLGLASLFAGAGAKYSWRGVCGCASKMNQKPLGERFREIYWWTGHDGQRILLKWHSLVPPGNKQSGGYSEAFDPVAAVDFLDSNEAFLSRYRSNNAAEPYHIRAAFGFGWDALNRKTGQPYLPDPKAYPIVDHFHEVAKQQSNERRQVVVSNEHDFFENFEKEHGSTLDTQSVTYGNEWDLLSASMSETSARVRRAVEKLRAAELLAAIVSLKAPDFMPGRVASRDRAFNGLGIFWEHNWTADGPISRAERAAWQEQVASEIEDYVDTLHRDAIKQLSGLISCPVNTNRFFVLNPLSWSRTEAADFAFAGSDDIHVIDVDTGKDVLHQFIELNGTRYLRIHASNIPPVGYKVFEIQPGPGNTLIEKAAQVSGPGNSSIENNSVKLVIDRDGAVRSMVDKHRGDTELAANIGGLWLNDFAANSAAGEPLQVVNSGPVSVTIFAQNNAGLDHATTITLYRDSDRIDVCNDINANFGDVRYWTFSFAFDQVVVHTEEVGAINLNKLQSAGGDYADTHARYDYITVNHFADVTSGSRKNGVTISNPDLAFAKLGNSTVTTLDTTTPRLQMLAGGQVDGAQLGITGQNGNKHFQQRFSLRPHGDFNPTEAMKFALEHQNPLVTGAIKSAIDSAYPADRFSLLKISNPDVLLWALKVAEEGPHRGLITRFWNLSDAATEAEITFHSTLKTAHRTTHIETDLEAATLSSDGSLPTTFTREQLQTYRIEFDE